MLQITKDDQSHAALLRIIDCVVATMERKASSDIEADRSEGLRGSYPFIPLNCESFIKRIQSVTNYFAELSKKTGKPAARPPKFCDAGCGIATKSMIASAFGFESHGVELDMRSIEKLKNLFHVKQVLTPKQKLMAKDKEASLGSLYLINWYSYVFKEAPIVVVHKESILEHDFSDYDVVYFYRPFTDSTLQSQFERRLMSDMKDGSVLIACGYNINPTTSGFGFQRAIDVMPEVFNNDHYEVFVKPPKAKTRRKRTIKKASVLA